MGCQCGKKPEDISVSLQKENENPTNVNKQNIQNKDDFVSMNRNKDSSVYFDHLNGQESSQLFKPLNSNNIANPSNMPPSSPDTKKILSPKKEQSLTNHNLTQNQRIGSNTQISESKSQDGSVSPKSKTLKKDKSVPNGNNLISMQQALGLPTNDSYADQVIFLLNEIRQDPKKIIPQLTEAKTKIITKNGKLLYISGVKVQLARGEQAFTDAIEFIETLNAMSPLTMNPEIMIDCPTLIEEIKTNQHLKESIQTKTNIKIDYFFRDLVHDPTTTLLLAIAGANEKYENKKRDALLNPNYKHIGLTSTVINKTFCAYFTFA